MTTPEPLLPARRVVVLGASNVQLGLPRIVEAARALAGGPVELMTALGHGRSYGRPSSIPGRRLPGVLDCRLWDDLAARPPATTHALVTDIGNDLLYGRKPERVVAWVVECVDRLAANGPVVVTGLPVANLETLSVWRYQAFRGLFFPALRLSLTELAVLAHELNNRLAEAMPSRAVPVVPLPPEWYGFDPIHFHRRRRREVWRSLLGELFGAETDTDAPSRPLKTTDALRLWTAPTAERELLGRPRVKAQPSVVFGDGVTASLY